MMCRLFGGHKYHMIDYSERLEVIFRMCANCSVERMGPWVAAYVVGACGPQGRFYAERTE